MIQWLGGSSYEEKKSHDTNEVAVKWEKITHILVHEI